MISSVWLSLVIRIRSVSLAKSSSKRIFVLQDGSSIITADSDAKRGADPFLAFETDSAKCNALGKCIVSLGR